MLASWWILGKGAFDSPKHNASNLAIYPNEGTKKMSFGPTFLVMEILKKNLKICHKEAMFL